MRALFALSILLMFSGLAMAEPQKPGPKDKCPVCGMFVAKYPDWIAQATLKGGKGYFFDGPKDMFKFVLDKRNGEAESILVTEYYDLQPIDARKAFFVHGSDVYGPMGHELIPFKTEADAKEFMRDHKGKGILKFQDVTAAFVNGL